MCSIGCTGGRGGDAAEPEAIEAEGGVVAVRVGDGHGRGAVEGLLREGGEDGVGEGVGDDAAEAGKRGVEGPGFVEDAVVDAEGGSGIV